MSPVSINNINIVNRYISYLSKREDPDFYEKIEKSFLYIKNNEVRTQAFGRKAAWFMNNRRIRWIVGLFQGRTYSLEKVLRCAPRAFQACLTADNRTALSLEEQILLKETQYNFEAFALLSNQSPALQSVVASIENCLEEIEYKARHENEQEKQIR